MRASPGWALAVFVVEQKPDSQLWRQNLAHTVRITDSWGAWRRGGRLGSSNSGRPCLQPRVFTARQRRGKPGPGVLGVGERPGRKGSARAAGGREGAAWGPGAGLPLVL